MFLKPEELIELTERLRKADQIAWLRQNQIPFLIGGNGHPRVSRAFIENRLAGRQGAATPQPNFAALES